MDLAAQSMDPHSAQISMDCAEICGSRSRPYLNLTFMNIFILLLSGQVAVSVYVIGELFSKYQPGTKRTCLIIVILRQLNAVTADAVFHTTPSPTVCYSVPSIVEVSGGCQSVNKNYICLRQRGIATVK